MKRLFLLLAILSAAWATAQELPYFAQNSFDGWIYNNPGVELSSSNIINAKIRLYVDSQGLVITLISPEFSCQGLDSIRADVKWRSGSEAIDLTLALDAADGTPLDSATCLPTSPSRDQDFVFLIPVPAGQATARLRFVSWHAQAATSGAVRRAVFTGITGQTHEVLLGDIDGNGVLSISDITRLISLVLSGSADYDPEVADIDGNGVLNISDITRLISMVLSGGQSSSIPFAERKR